MQTQQIEVSSRVNSSYKPLPINSEEEIAKLDVWLDIYHHEKLQL